MIVTIPVYFKLGSEFMPPLEEGSILYMPTTMPGISITEAQKLLQVTDRIIKQFPGGGPGAGQGGPGRNIHRPGAPFHAGNGDHPQAQVEWRKAETWYSSWAPEWAKAVFRHITPDHISQEELISQMNEALTFPGLANAWTMPIKGRIDMLSTGMRTPVGLKISGADLDTIEEIGARIEVASPSVKGTRSVFAERTGSGYFLDFEWNREELARYGLSIEEAQEVIEKAIGGENVTTTIEGRERYPVNVRYMRDFRADLEPGPRPGPGLRRAETDPPVAARHDQNASGPSMIRNEDGLLTGYVYVDIAGRDPNGYIEEAATAAQGKNETPAGIRHFLERPV